MPEKDTDERLFDLCVAFFAPPGRISELFGLYTFYEGFLVTTLLAFFLYLFSTGTMLDGCCICTDFCERGLNTRDRFVNLLF